METRPESGLHAWRILLLALARVDPGTDVTVDLIRDACDAAGLTSAEKSGALKHACTVGYLDGRYSLADGRTAFLSVISRHPAGKGRRVAVYKRTDKPIPKHVCREEVGVMATTYSEFIATKAARVPADGRIVDALDLPDSLHDWQADLVVWACRVGRAALWADTGLGKTRMQVAWADVMREGRTALIVAPLAVCAQTVREAANVEVPATYVRTGDEIAGPGVYVTNYEMVRHFDPTALSAVVLDESSILKQADGRTRTMLIEHFADVPYRLACTATPAPNDPEELTSQAEFLGHSTRANMLAAYFVHDQEGWRLKGHARRPMMKWMATWAVALRRPSDIGYDDAGYDLPGLHVIPHLIDVSLEVEGQLFATDLGGVGGRAKIRKDTLAARCARAAELVAAEPDEPWLLWCGLNAEAEQLAGLIPGAVNVHGGMSPEEKARALLAFADGEIRVLITKPSLAALGLNWQHCARMAFVGLSDSYEAYYQAIRRCYRYGQTRVVHAHIVLSEIEGQIAANVSRKENEAAHITAELVAEMRRAREDSAA